MDAASAYEAKAQSFLEVRDQSTIGSKLIADWANQFDSGSTVLELACGAGMPITQQLLEAKLNVYAIDSSAYLISIFQQRFPQLSVRCERVQSSDFFQKQFDGIVAVGLMFLLDEEEQSNLICESANALIDGGKFIFSAPIEKAKWQDKITGTTCQSLGIQKYQSLFVQFGLTMIDSRVDSGNNHYYVLQKS